MNILFTLAKAVIIPGCCSQSLLCSHWNSWQLAGDMLHIPWAQDLLLVSLCGCCEVQLVLCLPHSRAECVDHDQKPFCLLYYSLSVSLIIMLLFRHYLTHDFACHSFNYACVLTHWCFQLVCEVAAAGNGVPPFSLILAWGMTLLHNITPH